MPPDIRAFFDRYRDAFNRHDGEAVARLYAVPSSDFAIADLSWTIDRTGSQEPGRFHTTYNLARNAEGWRILLCTAYEEQQPEA